MENKREFILVSKEQETHNVTSLYFKTADGEKYNFKAGQYVDIKPPSIDGHGKSYTISSSPKDEMIRITVKKQGTVSSAIINMQPGDKVFFEGPYGVFYPEEGMKDVVMLAGGIGITPFFSVLNSLKSSNVKMSLLYSNKTKQDITFLDSLNEVCSENDNVSVKHFITQEKNIDNFDCVFSRINDEILDSEFSPTKGRVYYVCGSISFVRDLWQALKRIGVDENNIYTESFY